MQTADPQTVSATASLVSQQHVTALMSPLPSPPPQAVPQPASSLNEAFATRGVVNTVLANAGASDLCWLQNCKTAHKVHS